MRRPLDTNIMTKKNIATPKVVTEALTHNPFAGLASKSDHAANSPKPGTPCYVIRVPRVKAVPKVKPEPPCKLSLSLETTGRGGKVVTRIRGLPFDGLEAIASRLRKALGCGATLDGNDVLLLGSLAERASQWLESAGDLRTIEPERVASNSPKPSSTSIRVATTSTASSAAGTKRSDVRRGQRVAIVMKSDQSSGALTEGVVRELLTSSATHPHGIKVRLESGEVGRVKIIIA
jgi:uncharacterized repeat protein (TIGR03833 family)